MYIKQPVTTAGVCFKEIIISLGSGHYYCQETDVQWTYGSCLMNILTLTC